MSTKHYLVYEDQGCDGMGVFTITGDRDRAFYVHRTLQTANHYVKIVEIEDGEVQNLYDLTDIAREEPST